MRSVLKVLALSLTLGGMGSACYYPLPESAEDEVVIAPRQFYDIRYGEGGGGGSSDGAMGRVVSPPIVEPVPVIEEPTEPWPSYPVDGTRTQEP